MRLPPKVREGVEPALADAFGGSGRVARASGVGGGCISPAARVETETGDAAFLKWSGAADSFTPGMFAAEAAGLEALAATGAVRVPAVLAVCDAGSPDAPPAAASWILLEWLEPGGGGEAGWVRLGGELARMHRSRAERWGWRRDNFIGPLPQANGWAGDWAGFWRERRLEPQLRRACDAGHFGPRERERFEALFDRLDDVLAPAGEEGASLLHGDLWGGNVHMLRDGEPALIDPSSYHGHREVDLAMSELFGGFAPAFYGAYEAEWPLLPGYRSGRRAVYQLYYLLVHVNLFGAGYLSSTLAALSAAER